MGIDHQCILKKYWTIKLTPPEKTYYGVYTEPNIAVIDYNYYIVSSADFFLEFKASKLANVLLKVIEEKHIKY